MGTIAASSGFGAHQRLPGDSLPGIGFVGAGDNKPGQDYYGDEHGHGSAAIYRRDGALAVRANQHVQCLRFTGGDVHPLGKSLAHGGWLRLRAVDHRG